MLLELEFKDEASLKKLMEYALQLNIKMSLIDDFDELGDNPALPGKPYTQKEIQNIVEDSLDSGNPIDMKTAFESIRKELYGD